MKLQTEIKVKKQEHSQIDYDSKLVLLGSCFSENIGTKLSCFKFQSLSNPFGILFHPKAIETFVFRAVREMEYTEADVFFHNERWHCYDAHSKLSAVSKDALVIALNSNLRLLNKQIKEATHVIITLGTAWVYNLVESNQTVANCHKVPQKHFNKKLLLVKEISSSLKKTEALIHSVNEKVSLIFTVSPVRHIKDGFVENTLSKAHLITAIHQCVNQSPSKHGLQVFYFPAYEIMMDELREYRFYNADMLHPNDTAIEYIRQKFQMAWMDSKTMLVSKAVSDIQKGLAHKPFNEDSVAHKRFPENIKMKQKALQLQFPRLKF
ncbi:GSCFA domain-containing protein [Lacinutrix neustonica]|uniref:GSCFA domain-containing protein n=1 Tax=Lacinutrix neustonica TaxID=2980107 RepID=A0A9E8SCU0_9FLAO|nr:GSCFA domain-containing protein [Lacinutrix neustonica]WAC01698.1 GSCFA domain-containing protein [Lacinutrix neustonica]